MMIWMDLFAFFDYWREFGSRWRLYDPIPVACWTRHHLMQDVIRAVWGIALVPTCANTTHLLVLQGLLLVTLYRYINVVASKLLKRACCLVLVNTTIVVKLLLRASVVFSIRIFYVKVCVYVSRSNTTHRWSQNWSLSSAPCSRHAASQMAALVGGEVLEPNPGGYKPRPRTQRSIAAWGVR